MVSYLIGSKTQDHWKKFFDNITGSKHPTFNIETTIQFNETAGNALKELGATPLFDITLRGETYIKGAIFETSEDLLYFKIKFN
jgi:hypothetical protein